MSNLSPAFYKKLLEVASSTGMQPEHILNVMALESGLNPSAKSSMGGAVGLTQFIPSTLRSVGYNGSPQDFQKEPGEVQLEYIEKFIKSLQKYNGGKPFKSAVQFYVANFLPVSLRIPGVQQEDPDAIICSKNPTEPHLKGISIETEKKFYASNYGLDSDHDGNITYGDLQKKLNQVASYKSYKNSLNELAEHTGYRPGKSTIPGDSVKENDNLLAVQDYSKKPSSELFNLNNILETYLQQARAYENNTKLVKNSNFTIQVFSDNYIDTIEFARILCMALKEDLSIDAYTYTNGINTEVSGVSGNLSEINKLAFEISKEFKRSTKKIGSINITTNIINKKSSFKEISGSFAEINYRKFLLKFAVGK